MTHDDISKLFSIYSVQVHQVYVSKLDNKIKIERIKELLDKLHNLIMDRL